MEVKAGARRTLLKIIILPSWIVAAFLSIVFAFGLDVPNSWQYLPFAASLVFLGLPHGAVDHLVPGRLSGRVSWRSMIGVAALYAVLVFVGLALWFAAPMLAFALFIAITWFHWGQGDLYSLRAILAARHLDPRPARFLTVFVRGGLPMLVPLIAFPDVYESVARNATSLFGGGVNGGFVFAPAFASAFGYAAGAVFAVTALFTLASGYVRSRGARVPWLVDVGETLLLAAYFAVVPPVLAVGVYFCLWHAPRHIARLAMLDGPSAGALERGRVAPAALTFFRDAAPLTLAALALLAWLYLILPDRGATSMGALLGVYLVLISVLTPPHVAVVSLMDRRQGLWR